MAGDSDLLLFGMVVGRVGGGGGAGGGGVMVGKAEHCTETSSPDNVVLLLNDCRNAKGNMSSVQQPPLLPAHLSQPSGCSFWKGGGSWTRAEWIGPQGQGGTPGSKCFPPRPAILQMQALEGVLRIRLWVYEHYFAPNRAWKLVGGSHNGPPIQRGLSI